MPYRKLLNLTGISLTAVLLSALVSIPPAQAAKAPCSGAKGGVLRCERDKFLCRDGSISTSRSICTVALAAEYSKSTAASNSHTNVETQQVEKHVQPAGPLQQLRGSLVRVIDGDTLEIDGQVIRLEGIDAPEMKQSCIDANGKDYPCGRRSSAILSILIRGPVICLPSGKDKYGRYLGYCSSGDIDLNKEMVAKGWAMAFVKYSSRYVPEETTARNDHLGIWSGVARPPWDWRAAQIAELAPKGECVIKGNISHARKTYYLPFHLIYSRVRINEAAGERWFCTEADAIASGWSRAPR